MKIIPAPIDEKNISSDWFYDGLGDTNPYSLVVNHGSFYKCAFYRRFNLWEATWCSGFNTVTFKMMSNQLNVFDLEEFITYVKKSNENTGDDSLIIEFNANRLYTDGTFNMSFYFKTED